MAAPSGGTIAGSVMDLSTNEALPNVRITIPETGLSTGTNQVGQFQISGIPPGFHTVAAFLEGFEYVEQSINVIADRTVTVFFGLTLSSGSVAGTVMDRSTHQAVHGARVTIHGTGLEAYTGGQGQFHITSVPAGRQEARVYIRNERLQSKRVDVIPGKTIIANFSVSVKDWPDIPPPPVIDEPAEEAPPPALSYKEEREIHIPETVPETPEPDIFPEPSPELEILQDEPAEEPEPAIDEAPPVRPSEHISVSPILGRFIDDLIDEDEIVRHGALRSLRVIGKPALEALLEALTHPHPALRELASFAMGEMENEEVIGVLVEALQDMTLPSREDVVQLLQDKSGQAFSDDPSAWNNWWEETRPVEKSRVIFESVTPIPTPDPELAELPSPAIKPEIESEIDSVIPSPEPEVFPEPEKDPEPEISFEPELEIAPEPLPVPEPEPVPTEEVTPESLPEVHTYTYLGSWFMPGVDENNAGEPHGIAVGGDNNIYVADSLLHQVHVFNSHGERIRSFGSPGQAEGQMLAPFGIAVDNTGSIYVTERENHRVQTFDPEGNPLFSWGEEGIEPGQFYAPFGVTVDTEGYVYVADGGNNRVQKFDSNGNFITMWGTYGEEPGQFYAPFGVTVDTEGYVYVADWGNDRIQKFNADGNFITMWGGYGQEPGQFYAPFGISTDMAGNVFIAERGNHRVQKFDSNGNFITMWGSAGKGEGEFNNPTAITVSPQQEIFITDSQNNRICRYGPTNDM